MRSSVSTRFLRVLITSTAFGTVVVPLLATALLKPFATSPPIVADNSFATLLFRVSLFTAPFGAVLGALGGVWLAVFGPKCRSVIPLVVHGAFVGAVLSLVFCIFAIAADPTHTGINARFLMLTTSTGFLTGALYAAVFRKTLRGNNKQASTPGHSPGDLFMRSSD